MRISDWSSDVCSSDLDRARQYCCIVHPRTAEADVGQPATRIGWVFDTDHGKVAAAGSENANGSTISDPGERHSFVSGKRVSVRVDIGGRRIMKKKNKSLNISKYTFIILLQTFH